MQRLARRTGFRQAVLACLTLALLLVTGQVTAQYFGRNKVLWEDFDFHRLETPHFDLYHYPRGNPAARDAARMAERWYDRLSDPFDHRFADRKPIILYANHADFQQTTVGGGLIGEGTGGFTEPLRSRLVMPLTGSYAETDHVLGHEMVHVFQFDLAESLARGDQTGSALRSVPLWMVEGLAEYLSVGPTDTHTAMWLRDAAFYEELPTLQDLSRNPRRYFPYRFGHAFWAYVGGRWGEAKVLDLFLGTMGGGVSGAVETVLGMTPEQLSEDWKEEIRRTYEPLLEARGRPGEGAEPVLSRDRTRGDLNLAPAVSPDGKRVAFLSSRDLFTIDLYLADAESGEILGKLASAASTPHFDALRFIDSAGDWSPDGKRFAFTVVAKGNNQIAILDVASRTIVERLRIPEVGSISNPAFSPDGRHLVFSGTDDGITDLYTVEVATGTVEQLTDDRHADLQPVWSPDGETIAFVSDRGEGSDFDTLAYSPLVLSLLTVDSGQVRTLPVFDDAKHINPQFAPDGKSLLFIADPEGVSDLYRLELASGRVRQLTRTLTGVSGITASSPAMSVARRSGRVMFSLFRQAGYDILTLSPQQVAAGTELDVEAGAERTAAALPPRREPRVTEYLATPRLGLVEEESFGIEDYDGKLGLEYLGPVSVGTVADEFGIGVGGGVSAYFSDILGRHQLAVALRGETGSRSLSDQLGAQVTYLNRTDRLQWGAAGVHLPFLTGRTFVGTTEVEIDGETVTADLIQQIREEVTIDQVGLISEYPLSLNRRFEAGVYYTGQDFDREIEEIVVLGNQILERRTTEVAAPEALSLVQGSVAFVQDTSFFGFTAPVRGTRMRLEAGTTSGDLSYQTARIDYRRYFFRRPVTLAFRGLHFGRYGSDAESPRLSPLFLGRETLVRGYSVDSFDVSECTAVPGRSSCPEFDRLIGSRLGILNLELRLPLLGTEDFGLIEAPYLPTDLIGFVDIGTAWNADESPELRFDEETIDRVPVASAGLSLRTLLGGYVPLEIYAAHPFHRPTEDLVLGFLIAPGW